QSGGIRHALPIWAPEGLPSYTGKDSKSAPKNIGLLRTLGPDEVRVPDIGEGVAEGEILKWLVKEGDQVKEDQSLVEVMTDKVNVQIPSPKSGVIAKTLAKEGEVVKVGQPVLVI